MMQQLPKPEPLAFASAINFTYSEYAEMLSADKRKKEDAQALKGQTGLSENAEGE